MTGWGSYVYKISMETSTPGNGRPKPTVRNKMMDLLARREHSEADLRQKLEALYTPEEVESAIEFAKKSNWIAHGDKALQELAEKTANDLRRRGKGAQYINQYLEQKGLPQVDSNASEELDKAHSLVENKFPHFASLNSEEKEQLEPKIGRFLMARGFDEEIVRKVVYGKD